MRIQERETATMYDSWQVFHDRFDQLEVCLNGLEDTMGDLLLKPILCDLLGKFRTAARDYFEAAEDAIQVAHASNRSLPVEYHAGKVLNKITDHVYLLADLFEQVKGKRSSKFIQRLTWSIASTIRERPILIPILATQFKYIHLNYVQGVGIIGIPPSVWYGLGPQSAPWNWRELPVLWHEVAGFWVAQMRRQRTGNGEGSAVWAQELQDKLRRIAFQDRASPANAWGVLSRRVPNKRAQERRRSGST